MALLGVCSAVACAADATPVYSWSWSEEDGATVDADGWTSFNYTEGNDYATFDSSSNAVYKRGITDVTGSFTFTLDLRNPSATASGSSAWKAYFTLYATGATTVSSPYIYLTQDNSGQLYLYQYNAFGGNTVFQPIDLGVTLSATEWTTVTLVSDLENDTFSVYVNGEEKASFEGWTIEAGLGGVQFGKAFGGTSNRPVVGTVEVNNIAIYNSAVYSVPEPATATLSLLALAGLAARRRRK